jgi:hypothetical protein
LLIVHFGNAITLQTSALTLAVEFLVGYSQQVALQSQCHRRFRLHDGLACFLDIDIQDSFACYFLRARLRTQRRDEPVDLFLAKTATGRTSDDAEEIVEILR